MCEFFGCDYCVLLTINMLCHVEVMFIQLLNLLKRYNVYLHLTSWWWACSKHVEAWNKLIIKQKFCASSRLIAEINRVNVLGVCRIIVKLYFYLRHVPICPQGKTLFLLDRFPWNLKSVEKLQVI